jgi:membrane protease YdiL (CAAX protease family)
MVVVTQKEGSKPIRRFEMKMEAKLSTVVVLEIVIILGAFATPSAMLLPDSPLGGLAAGLIALLAIGTVLLVVLYTCKRFWGLKTWREAWVEFNKKT